MRQLAANGIRAAAITAIAILSQVGAADAQI